MTVIYDQFNRPIKQSKAPERAPLAAAPIMDTWREYVTSGLTPQRLATMLQEADAGDVRRQAELFDQMEEKDAHLLGERGKRVNVILDMAIEVRPASEDSRDQRIAEFVETTLNDITDWADVLTGMQDAVGKGFATHELHWDVSEGQAVPQRIEFLEQRRFTFVDPSGYLRNYPLLLSDDDLQGAEIPAWKTLLHRYGGNSGHPARAGVHRVCAWMFLFKNYSLKDWVVFCEVYGMPLRLGKYDSGASADDKSALLTAISSLGSDAAGIISRNTEIEFIEAVRGAATGELYQGMANFCNAEMSKALLGQTLSAEVGDKGSYAAAKTHNEVRMDLVLADARALASTVRHQLIRPLVGFNFGWDAPVPKYEVVWEESEDLKAKSDWVGALLDRGVEMPLGWLRTEFAIPEPENGEATIGGGNAAPVTAKLPAKVARNRTVSDDLSPEATLARIGAQALKEAPLEQLMVPIEQALKQAGSLSEFKRQLASLEKEGLDDDELGIALARALAVADLAGRFDGNA